MKKKKSSVKGDIPWTIFCEYSVEPNIWKYEYVTPAPKVFPPGTTDDLRKISGTKNCSKIYEALISETVLSDMAPSIDKSQDGNQKGLSI